MLLVLVPLSGAAAADIIWTDWQTATTNQVNGVLTIGSDTVNVQYNGPYAFAQTGGGINYWSPSTPYISATVPNVPPGTDIIALSTGGAKTITFSQPVTDPLLALVSWNSNTVDFRTQINVLSFGQGYWGNGTPVINSGGTGFYGQGEVHGVIELPGTFSSIAFTDTSESWHGFTLGVRGVAATPLPAGLWLMGSGLLALIGLRGYRRR